MSGETILNNRYKLVAQQGSGGMAVIYKAVDMSLGRNVAIKILRPSLTADPQFIARFQNEARSIANLIHPNIVTVHDVGSDGPTNYIVMEFIDGYDLKKIIRAHGTLAVDRALNIAISICAGLGYAHRARIVHADVKPQNILITQDDVVKLTDFGIAQALTDTQPSQRADVVWGSPHYFAPEQAQGEKPTAASDVYSIGIVMFEMVTGRLPYTGANQQELARAHISTPIPRADEVNPDVPEGLANIIYKVMSKKPTDRYSRADQLGRVLIAFRDHAMSPTMRDLQIDLPDLTGPQQKPAQPSQRQQPAGQSQQASRQQQPAPSGPLPQRTPPPPSAPPTQRYSVAPHAPEPVNYQQRSGAAAVPQSPLRPPPPAGRAPERSPFAQQSPYAVHDVDEDIESVWDGVTIALAVLAFLSVACLMPLYILVLNARV